MTNEEALLKAFTTILKQDGTCKVGGACFYRGEYYTAGNTDEKNPLAGKVCGVGALIPDDVYDPAMERAIPKELFARYPKLRTEWNGLDLNMLAAIQHSHDNLASDKKGWESRLYDDFVLIAISMGLPIISLVDAFYTHRRNR